MAQEAAATTAAEWPRPPGPPPASPGPGSPSRCCRSNYLSMFTLSISERASTGAGVCDSGPITQLSLQGPHHRGSDVAPCPHPLCPTSLTSGLIVLPWGGGATTPPHPAPRRHSPAALFSRGGFQVVRVGEPHSGLALSQRKRGEASAKEREGGGAQSWERCTEPSELSSSKLMPQALGGGRAAAGRWPQGGGLSWEISCPCATREHSTDPG